MKHSFRLSSLLLVCVYLAFCSVTTNEVRKLETGQPVAWADLAPALQKTGATVRFQRIVAADWAVDRAGLIDLDHPAAIAADLQKGQEPIQVVFYSIEHPERGRYLIDTGMGQIFTGTPESWPVNFLVRSAMNMESLKIHTTLQKWLAAQPELKGVFLTHLHMDHILGAADVATDVPFYVGPGEARVRHWQNLVVQGSTDRLLTQGRVLDELVFPATAPNEGLAVLDFFGDGSFYVLHSPGHTAGSLAFLVRGVDGNHLVLGDTCHTAWGWRNNVTPGTFTSDRPRNAMSLDHLQKLAVGLPGVYVHPGHQSL